MERHRGAEPAGVREVRPDPAGLPGGVTPGPHARASEEQKQAIEESLAMLGVLER